MKTNLRKILFGIFTFIFMIGMVSAETISDSFKVDSYTYSNTPMSFPQTFRVKKTSTDKYAYCTYYSKTPPTGQKYVKKNKVTDSGMNYILKESMSSVDSNSDFFVYQTALWIYMSDKGIMEGPHQSIKTFKSNVNNSSSSTATKIKNLVSNAKKASANDTTNPSISIGNTSNVNFKLNSDGTKYVSSAIKITSNTNDYKVNLDSAPKGTTVKKDGKNIYISIPASSVILGDNIVKFSVKNSKTLYSAYNYKSSSSDHQPVAVPFKQTKSANDNASVKLTITKDVTISKQDIATSKELPGAKLKLVNENGKIVDEWTSTNKPHIIKNLPAGTYKLTETIAPEGYVLSTETIKFTLNKNGKLTDESGKSIDKIVMYNEKEQIPEEPKPEEPQGGGVSISKQDITNKEELPGAHLVVKDYEGNIIDEWVSTNEPHLIEKLPAGIYTLTETIAPEGYILSTETITFTVKDDGSITEVVMYNTPDTKEIVPEEPKPDVPKQEVQVEDTASFKTMTSSIIGLGIILIGLSMIFKNKKEA